MKKRTPREWAEGVGGVLFLVVTVFLLGRWWLTGQ